MELVIRTSAILLGAWLGARLLSRASAATRHLWWHTTLLMVLAAPLVSPLVPPIGIPGLGPLSTVLQHRIDTALPLGSEPASVTSASEAALTPPHSDATPSAATPPAASPIPLLRPEAVWAIGSLLLALWFAAGWLLAGRKARTSAPVPSEWQRDANDIARRLHLERDVTLGMLASDGSPLTIGIFTPRILLPPASRTWTRDERRAVLVHELAHVARKDTRLQLVAQAACVLYWFNPLIWLAAGALGRERERACDAAVLEQGARPSDYAACLLQVARLVNKRRVPTAALAMARTSELEGRLLALFRDRPTSRSARARALAPLVVVIGSFALLGATPVRENAVPAAQERHASALMKAYAPTVRAKSPSIDALTTALDDRSADVREKAALTLALRSDPQVIEPLIRALADPDAQVREKAALGLALRRDTRVIDPLLKAMKDPDAQVREKAAIALGTSGDERARAALEAATRDPDAQVREKAITGLMLLDTAPADLDGARLRNGLQGLVGGLLEVLR